VDRALLLMALLAVPAGPPLQIPVPATPSGAQPARDDPDRLYADRAHLPSARRAADLWEARGASDTRDFEAAWKLARACYWLGGHVPDAERRREYERGIDAAKRAAKIEPRRPEGHFWMAANMGAMAESFGLVAGLRYRGAVKRELETVLAIDPSYQQGSADRALGRWYLRVPGLLGGSKRKSVEHLQRSLGYNPDSVSSHYFLAETYLEIDRGADARAELRRVLDAPVDPDWAPEDREFKLKAARLLETLGVR